MKIAIYQSLPFCADNVRRCLAAVGLEDTIPVVNSTEEVLTFVVNHKDEEIILVSSDVTHEMGILNADQLAEAAKAINPSVNVFSFSTMPRSKYHIVGQISKDINKSEENMIVVLQDILENGYNPHRLQEKFSNVNFLLTVLNEN